MDLVSSFLSKKNINNEEDIKFENYIKGEAKLNSEKQYIIESSCCFDGNKDNFKRHYDENKILEIHLNNMLFEQDLVFDNVKKLSLIINDNVKFNKLFINNCNELYLQFNGRVEVIDKISINDCKFKQISINNHIDGNIEFQKCEFNDFNLYGFSNATIKGTFTFDFCEIKEKVNFMNFEFENKVSFKMSKFKDNVYFNNSHFKDYVDFHECEFEKIACFYGVKFYKTPNFSACYFKEPKAVNLINVDIDKLDFKSVEKYIEDNYQDESYKNAIKNNEKIQKDEKELYRIENEHKLRYAKNLKDSFRVIKDVLINQNNTLEAQEWHKLELYAKEKELEIQLSKNKNDNLKKESKNQVYNPKDYEKFNYSKIIPLIIFLLKIIGHLSVNILIFVELVLVAPFFTIMFYCVYVVFFIYKILTFILKSFYPLDINKFIIFWRIKFNKIKRKLIVSGRKMLDFTLWSDCVLLQVYRNTSNHHTNFLK
ncbi:pentapeptide repeat-containing protein, partial [Campylobacter jejuni]